MVQLFCICVKGCKKYDYITTCANVNAMQDFNACRDGVPLEKESVLVLLLVRKNPHGGGYEIIARHRRKEAALWAGLTGFDFDRREREIEVRRNVVTDKDLTRDGKWKYNWTERKQQE